ncbi:tetratricopeptide repeat protein [Candidatus Poribacteria bacterium]|nr:tetratricopeptide repeat protein [Candidatus Poribacteria bacterium]
MSIKILSTFLCVALISLISITHGTAQESSNADYFDHITLFSDGRITRFTQMPIQVYISPVIKESPYLAELQYAMRKWETATEGLIRFKETDIPANADIRVSWGFSSLMDIHDTRLGSAVLTRLDNTVRTFSHSTGYTSKARQTQQIPTNNSETTRDTNKDNFRVEIILMLEGDETVMELSQEEMRTVCLHEFAHALGLWGHSPHPGDICYPTATAQHPTQRDINTLRKLYSTPIDTPQHNTAINALKTEIALAPRQHYPRYLLGAVYFDKGDMESAIGSFKDCLKRNENFQPAIEKLLQAYQETGQLGTAINLLEQRVKEKPSAADYNTLGIHYYHQGEVNRAMEAFERAVKLEPFHKAAKHNLHQLFREKAFYALNAKDFASAMGIFEKITQLNPLDSTTYMLMGDGYASAERYTTAIQHYQKALELNPVSRLAKRGLAQCYNNHGVTLRNSKKWDDAIAAYRKALEVYPKFHISRTNLSDAFWQKANNHRKLGQVDEAIKTYLELQKLHPNDTHISSLLGELYLKKRNFSDAVSAFQKVYMAEPDTPQARHNLIAAYHQSAQDLINQKNYRAAIELLQKAVTLLPTASNLRVSLAHAYQNIGDYQRAQAELAHVLKGEPNNQQATTEQINLYIRRGNALVQQKNYPAALAQFTAIPETERDVIINNIIGYLYLVQGEFSEALTAFEKVIAKDPRNRSTYLNLVSLESQVANRLFEKSKADKLIRARCLLAICLLNQKQPDAALTKYEQAKDSKSEKHQQILYHTGIQLARGFEAQNDTERSATIRQWLGELNYNVNEVLDDR